MNSTNWAAVAAWISLACTAVTAGVVFGDMRGRVERNSSDIERMQADARQNADKLNDIRIDVREIKTTLRVLLPTPASEDSR